MNVMQGAGLLLIVAGIVWMFLHPKETGEGEVGFKGLSAKGLTQGGLMAALGAALFIAPLVAGEDDPKGSSETGSGPSTTVASASCRVTGTVFEQDSGQPFAGVDVGLMTPGSTFVDEESFAEQATTDPQGRFAFDCELEEGDAAVLALSDAAWGGCLDVTRRQVHGGRATGGVTLYVSDKVQRLLGKLFGLPENDNCERG
jgi:hypothetical protein